MCTINGHKDIMQMARGYMYARILFLAHELNVFDKLSDKPLPAKEIARLIEGSERGTAKLLNAMTAIGLLQKRDDMYILPDKLKPYLLRDGKNTLRNYLELNRQYWSIWTDMDIMVKEGRPVGSIMELIENDKAKMNMFISAMADRARFATREIPNVLDINKFTNMLDVGCGPGTYSFEWMKINPNLRTTLFDVKEALGQAKKFMAEYAITDNVTFMPGDFRKTEFAVEEYDFVLIANLLQMYGEDDCRNLLKKTFKALKPGGAILIHGYVLDVDETEPLYSTIFALSIAAVTPHGAPHVLSKEINWLEEAGFKNIKTAQIDASPPTILWAEK